MKRANRLTLFADKKRRGEKIVVLTAYDVSSARIACDGGVDAILVGDSVGMVVMGHENTLPVTVDDMVHHCRAVMRARPDLPVIADLPYGSFHVSPAETVGHALRLIKVAGVSAVKVEGGRKRQAMIEALLAAEIPVMGHLGLTPQSIHRFGGYKVQGRGTGAAEVMLEEARFLAEIGCFSLVLECIPEKLAARITAEIGIPTIGIGAGPNCDGQVLVYHDLVGLFAGGQPKFVKRYAELGDLAVDAVRRYADEVRSAAFPGPEHSYDDPVSPPSSRRDLPPRRADGPTGYLASLDKEES